MADWNEGYDRQYQQLQQQIADGGNVAQIQQQMQSVVQARDEAARAEAYRNDQWHREHGTGPYAPAGGVTGGVGGSVAPPPAFSAQQILENLLQNALGISGLGTWAADLYNRGASPTEIVQAVRYGTDTSPGGQAARKAYLEAFPGMDTFLKEGIFAGESPELQYIQYRNTVKEAAERYGVDPSLMSKEAIAKYIGSRNSAAELVQRMGMAATAIATTPVETLAALDQFYGVKDGDLMSFYLDTDQTEAMLQKRYAAARIGGEGARNAFGVDKTFSEDLVDRGYSAEQASAGFQQAAGQRGFQYGRGDTVTEGELLGGTFGNETQAEAIQRVAASRRNRFEGQGGFTTSKAGMAGLGSSAG